MFGVIELCLEVDGQIIVDMGVFIFMLVDVFFDSCGL